MTSERKQAEKITAGKFYCKRYGFSFDVLSSASVGYIRPDQRICLSFDETLNLMEAYASLTVAEATKDMYPKAFIIWKDMNTEYFPYGNTYCVKDIDVHFVGLDLLFGYWKQNIKHEA